MASLLEFLSTIGRLKENDLHELLIFDKPYELFYVTDGALDVYFQLFSEKNNNYSLQHFDRFQQGQIFLVPKITDYISSVRLVGKSSLHAKIVQIDVNKFTGHENQCYFPNIAAIIDVWLEKLYQYSNYDLIPQNSLDISSAVKERVKAGSILFVHSGTRWLKTATELYLYGDQGNVFTQQQAWPIGNRGWVSVAQEAEVSSFTTEQMLEQGFETSILIACTDLLMELILIQNSNDKLSQGLLLLKRIEEDKNNFSRSLWQLSCFTSVKKKFVSSSSEHCDKMSSLLMMVAEAEHITAEIPASVDRALSPFEQLTQLLSKSKIRARQVLLKSNWWKINHDALLAFKGIKAKPIALITDRFNHYYAYEGKKEEKKLVDEQYAEDILPTAFSLYKKLPNDNNITLLQLVKLGLDGLANSIALLIFLCLFSGLLGLLTPLMTQYLFDSVIPGAAYDQLLTIAVALLAAAIGISLFQICQGFCLLRIQGKFENTLQPQLWDRLLRLNVGFFRRFTAGDLAMRVNGINQVRELLAGSLANQIMSGLVGLLNVGILFYYSTTLSIVALLFLSFFITIITVLSLKKLQVQRKIMQIQGELNGVIGQLILGITKLRTTASESRAFAFWAPLFAHLRRHSYIEGLYNCLIAPLLVIIPILGSILLFATMAYWLADEGLSAGQFIAFNMAFGSLLSSLLSLANAVIEAIETIPLFERAKPILTAPFTEEKNKALPKKFQGHIVFDNVSFKYEEQGPLVLDQVSFRVHPGEFVALVGRSGAGKSSIGRLILKFEHPNSGKIYIDHQDSDDLDAQAIRQQMGVVLQDGDLIPGDIYTNIAGSSVLSMQDAWLAAERAGFAEDIRAMPMQMSTVVPETGGGLSGGQKQRLLIARALAFNPRIILFDEATSALDNANQKLITDSLQQLQATRIIIAHRLSTIINADTILVLDRGRIVQQGKYQQLMQQEGLFRQIAARQTLT